MVWMSPSTVTSSRPFAGLKQARPKQKTQCPFVFRFSSFLFFLLLEREGGRSNWRRLCFFGNQPTIGSLSRILVLDRSRTKAIGLADGRPEWDVSSHSFGQSCSPSLSLPLAFLDRGLGGLLCGTCQACYHRVSPVLLGSTSLVHNAMDLGYSQVSTNQKPQSLRGAASFMTGFATSLVCHDTRIWFTRSPASNCLVRIVRSSILSRLFGTCTPR
ncbi:hypothetical protein B0T19DRAFT_423733 [Cercophora scortea]|uniref:Uncharacterized protein n=1 Tax=Cercophora scortea TaxID=314031 RepID=A0AAE0IN77_9PEZI|nr:hypothetical protein B0T19DRAFT_423733 [Cercophora scortea]